MTYFFFFLNDVNMHLTACSALTLILNKSQDSIENFQLKIDCLLSVVCLSQFIKKFV